MPIEPGALRSPETLQDDIVSAMTNFSYHEGRRNQCVNNLLRLILEIPDAELLCPSGLSRLAVHLGKLQIADESADDAKHTLFLALEKLMWAYDEGERPNGDA